MTKIIFIRHGQTEWNLTFRYQGHTDIALTELGRRQAHCVAQRLANEPLAAIYSSDLSRAWETAETIAACHTLPVVAKPALREMNFGDWEGLTYGGIVSAWPAEMENFFRAPAEVAIPGGEKFSALQHRIGAALDEIIAAHPDETVAVVSHGGAIRAALCAALCMPLNAFWHIRQDNTAVNRVTYFPDEARAVVELVNDVNHLTQLAEGASGR